MSRKKTPPLYGQPARRSAELFVSLSVGKAKNTFRLHPRNYALPSACQAAGGVPEGPMIVDTHS